MNISQLITGIVLICFGIFLIILSFIISEAEVVVLIYGLVALVVGGFIFFNTREDKIEQIKKGKRR